jgi:hypothetical protein
MKNIFIVGILIILVSGLTSCTIEKRHFRNGYYVDWHTNDTRKVASQADRETEVESVTILSAEASNSQEQVPVRTEIVVPLSSQVDAPGQVNETQSTGHFNKRTDAVEIPEVYSSESPAPIEKSKEQAVGAGIAAALFFLLGMAGLFIQGAASPFGAIIVGAFICCLLCIVLASFLYPRETPVKQPKVEAESTGDKNGKGITKVGLGITLLVATLVLLYIGAILILIFSLPIF